MKKLLMISLTLLVFISCNENEKDDSIKKIEPEKHRNAFVLAGDTTGCQYSEFKQEIKFKTESDSFDINFDGKFDIEFKIHSVNIDNCQEILANCPSGLICDCWPTIYTDYIINLGNNTELAINNDSTIHEFKINDTISFKNKWTKHTKYPMYHQVPHDNWTGSYVLLGLRTIVNIDTLYSWLDIKLTNSEIGIKKTAIQK